MDYTAVKTNSFVGELKNLFGTDPIGVASAFSALNGRLNEVVKHLGGDLGVEAVRNTVDLRQMIGEAFDSNDGDYKHALQVFRLEQNPEYFKQRGHVACHLLEGLKPEPFKDDNDLSLEQLSWIIPSLLEARPAFSLDVTEDKEKFMPELREANALQLALSGIPEENAECKFLLIQELAVARMIGSIPSTILLGYWQSLKPKNPTAIAIHATAEEVLAGLPCQDVSETEYIENGLLMLSALAETVCSASKDWNTRVLCQQSTEYIFEARKGVEEMIQVYASRANDRGIDLSGWQNRCQAIIDQINTLLEDARKIPVCKHFELGHTELSAYAENYAATDEDGDIYLVIGC